MRLLASLGFVLASPERCEEVRRCHDAPIRLGELTGAMHIGVAETCLLEGAEPQKALDRIEQAMAAVGRRHGGRVDGETWASRAWALALPGRWPDAQASIEQVPEPINSTFRAAMASPNWPIGKALLAMGETERTVDQFRAGADADPRGNSGRLALEQAHRAGH